MAGEFFKNRGLSIIPEEGKNFRVMAVELFGCAAFGEAWVCSDAATVAEAADLTIRSNRIGFFVYDKAGECVLTEFP